MHGPWVQAKELQLLDVRERAEHSISHLPDFVLYPLSEAPQWSEDLISELDAEKETIVLCHHGMRSMQLAMVSEANKE